MLKKSYGACLQVVNDSAYGSLLQNPARYKNIKYVKLEYNAPKLANEPLFSQLSELDSVNQFYEIQMHKKVT